jgi:hypothetical protein
MRMVLLLAFVLAGLGTAIAQSGGETRQYFKDWLAACRADGYCSATAYQNPNPGNGTVADYIVRIGRHAEGTYWEVSFTTVAAMADETQPFEVFVDDAGQTFHGPNEIAAYGAVNDFFLLGPKAQTTMDGLAPGSELAIAFEDTDGNRQQAVFSLSGLTASLIWIDEQQRRLGSERVAQAPPVGLDAARGAGGGAAAIPPALLAHRMSDTDCLPMENLVNGADIETGMLDGSYPIYFIPCWGGAYNFSSKAYVERFEGEFSEMAFAQFTPESGWTATTHLVNYGWDPATQSIITFNKSRGLGDCGSSGEWRWEEFGFRLVEFRSKRDCDDAMDDDAPLGEFPIVYSEREGLN